MTPFSEPQFKELKFIPKPTMHTHTRALWNSRHISLTTKKEILFFPIFGTFYCH